MTALNLVITYAGFLGLLTFLISFTGFGAFAGLAEVLAFPVFPDFAEGNFFANIFLILVFPFELLTYFYGLMVFSAFAGNTTLTILSFIITLPVSAGLLYVLISTIRGHGS